MLWSQAFLEETVETGNKNRCVTEATHVLRRKLRFLTNWSGVVTFYCMQMSFVMRLRFIFGDD